MIATMLRTIEDFFTALIWRMCFEYINDFPVGDKERIVGSLKPTRFARFIDWLCVGRHVG